MYDDTEFNVVMAQVVVDHAKKVRFGGRFWRVWLKRKIIQDHKGMIGQFFKVIFPNGKITVQKLNSWQVRKVTLFLSLNVNWNICKKGKRNCDLVLGLDEKKTPPLFPRLYIYSPVFKCFVSKRIKEDLPLPDSAKKMRKKTKEDIFSEFYCFMLKKWWCINNTYHKNEIW